MNAVLLLLGFGLAFPVPCLALLGAINQRHRLKQERARFATLKRISGGWRR